MMKPLILLALASAAFAQQQDFLIHRAAPGEQVQFFTSTTNPVKGAPYMAEAVTETVQRLADGTRIANTTTTRLYRDSEGRTRTDTTLKPLGPWVAEGTGGGKAISSIFDPVTNESLTLHHDTKLAHRANMRTRALAALPPKGEPGAQPVRIDVEKRVIIAGAGSGEAPVGDVLMPGPGTIHFIHEGPGPAPGPGGPTHVMIRDKVNAQTKPLGKRMIEGVECEGSLTTLTIPEGQIGNDRPIEVITEVWRAPSLKIDVVRKHNDPRYGETNYRLINLVRAEQPRSLFEIPSGYELKELPATFNIKVDPPKAHR